MPSEPSQHSHRHAVEHSFGSRADAYLSSAVHAQGADLEALGARLAATPGASVLDLGCGAGHVSFAVAPYAGEIVAYDPTEAMLRVVADTAASRGFTHLRTQSGAAEQLPFPDRSFDWVLSRYSAHHWSSVPSALREVRRVLKPHGQVCFIDVTGGPEPLLDTHLQAVELLRDPSHVRNYSTSEWLAMFSAAGFTAHITQQWRLPIEFSSWVARIGTSESGIAALRTLWKTAPSEVRDYYSVRDDLSFELDVASIDARPA